MTIQEFNKLHPALQDVIGIKSSECEKDLETYLADTEKNYVIASASGNIVEWGSDTDYDYVVYGDKEGALEDLCEDEGEFVITEAMGILLLNSKIMLNKY